MIAAAAPAEIMAHLRALLDLSTASSYRPFQ